MVERKDKRNEEENIALTSILALFDLHEPQTMRGGPARRRRAVVVQRSYAGDERRRRWLRHQKLEAHTPMDGQEDSGWTCFQGRLERDGVEKTRRSILHSVAP
eukprot:3180946-Prymnesium_polylepis.1